MRILIHGINYAPELTGIGKYTGDMAEWLAAQGHDVRVVTAPPYYPAWKLGDGYRGWRYRKECLNGVEVYRCPLWVPRRPSGSKRILHLAGFALAALPVMLWQALCWRPALVMVVEPPLFCSPAALMAARLANGRSWLHIQDFEVDAAFELGLLPPGRLKKHLERVESWLMRRFDQVSTISEKMLARLDGKGVPAPQRVLFPNWVDTHSIHPLEQASPLRRELKIPEDAVLALYSGNMGAKQGLEILIEVASRVASAPHIQFVLCGDGALRETLQAQAAGLKNVRFLPLQPSERLNQLLNMADIHLLPQRADVADLVMPSKLTGMLASGRPVVATAFSDTQVGRIVARCGLVVPPGNADAMANAVRYLADRPQERRQLGRQARQFCLQHWSREKILGDVFAEIEHAAPMPKALR